MWKTWFSTESFSKMKTRLVQTAHTSKPTSDFSRWEISIGTTVSAMISFTGADSLGVTVTVAAAGGVLGSGATAFGTGVGFPSLAATAGGPEAEIGVGVEAEAEAEIDTEVAAGAGVDTAGVDAGAGAGAASWAPTPGFLKVFLSRVITPGVAAAACWPLEASISARLTWLLVLAHSGRASPVSALRGAWGTGLLSMWLNVL